MGVIVDRFSNEEVFSFLDKHSIKYIKSFDMDGLYQPVNTHPDMQIHFFDEVTAVSAPKAYSYYKDRLPKSITLLKGDKDPDCTYPGDCAYNVAKVGKKVIGKLSCVDAVIKEIYSQKGYDFITVNQGYTKCNLLIVDENSVITEDVGLSNNLRKCGIDVLTLKTLSVKLKNFNNGFIGGASGFISKDTILFTGNIKLHPEYQLIKSFIKERKVNIISLSSTALEDFGSVLYFKDSF